MMKRHAALVILFIILSAFEGKCDTRQSRVVNTTQGPVRGYLDPDGDIFSFHNIPYASAPTGSHRFRAPLPPPLWEEPFEAVDRRIICPQMLGFAITDVFQMQEDCLIANVFVPNTTDNNLPVLVSVHGGAFQFGFGNQHLYRDLVRSNKLIVVSFNYRLGPHGFLCLGTEDVPGNAGMKDQVALLRWVNRNIANFGGNPNDVTISGCSAGGSSVHMLMLSKMTDGLLNKAIPESGVSIGGAGLQADPVNNAKIYAKMLNFTDVDDFKALENFYKNISYKLLTSQTLALVNRPDSTILLGPCLERDTGSERFFDDTPRNILKTDRYKNLPQLYGFADLEGLFRLPNFYDWKDRMNDKFADFLPFELYFSNETEKEEVAQTVKSFYFGNQNVSEATILNYVDYFSDVMFIYPMLKTLKWHTEYSNSSIYLYEYSFVDENTPLIPYTDARGADHCKQSFAVADEDETNITAEYKNMKITMRALWLNFVLNGNPMSEDVGLSAWPRANSDRSPHMSLGRTIELKGLLLEQRATFWDKIYQQYYRDPIAPSSSNSANIKRLPYFLFTLITFYFTYTVCNG